MRKLYVLILSISCSFFFGCNDTGEGSDPKREVDWSPEKSLQTDQIMVIGEDGGSGKTSGSFYDVNKPVDNDRPVMRPKRPGIIKDGVYRLRNTDVEGAERVIRSARKEKYDAILKKSLYEKAYGVIQVTDLGKRIIEWRFTDESDVIKREFAADGQGALIPKQAHPCALAYFTDKKDVGMSTAEGAFEIVLYCPKQGGVEYEKYGIADHHELWTLTYEPYNKSF